MNTQILVAALQTLAALGGPSDRRALPHIELRTSTLFPNDAVAVDCSRSRVTEPLPCHVRFLNLASNKDAHARTAINSGAFLIENMPLFLLCRARRGC